MVSDGAVTLCVYFCISFRCALALLICLESLSVFFLCLMSLWSALTVTPSLLSWGSHYVQWVH